MADPSGSIIAKRHTYGEDCFNCRLVSGAGIIAMGIYVFTAAKKQKTAFNRNFIYCLSTGKSINKTQIKRFFFINTNSLLFCFFLGIFGIGAARLFALPPFQRTTSD